VLETIDHHAIVKTFQLLFLLVERPLLGLVKVEQQPHLVNEGLLPLLAQVADVDVQASLLEPTLEVDQDVLGDRVAYELREVTSQGLLTVELAAVGSLVLIGHEVGRLLPFRAGDVGPRHGLVAVLNEPERGHVQLVTVGMLAGLGHLLGHHLVPGARNVIEAKLLFELGQRLDVAEGVDEVELGRGSSADAEEQADVDSRLAGSCLVVRLVVDLGEGLGHLDVWIVEALVDHFIVELVDVGEVREGPVGGVLAAFIVGVDRQLREFARHLLLLMLRLAAFDHCVILLCLLL